MAAWWRCLVDTLRGLVLLFYRIKQTDLSFEETLISFWGFSNWTVNILYTLSLMRTLSWPKIFFCSTCFLRMAEGISAGLLRRVTENTESQRAGPQRLCASCVQNDALEATLSHSVQAHSAYAHPVRRMILLKQH